MVIGMFCSAFTVSICMIGVAYSVPSSWRRRRSGPLLDVCECPLCVAQNPSNSAGPVAPTNAYALVVLEYVPYSNPESTN